MHVVASETKNEGEVVTMKEETKRVLRRHGTINAIMKDLTIGSIHRAQDDIQDLIKETEHPKTKSRLTRAAGYLAMALGEVLKDPNKSNWQIEEEAEEAERKKIEKELVKEEVQV